MNTIQLKLFILVATAWSLSAMAQGNTPPIDAIGKMLRSNEGSANKESPHVPVGDSDFELVDGFEDEDFEPVRKTGEPSVSGRAQHSAGVAEPRIEIPPHTPGQATPGRNNTFSASPDIGDKKKCLKLDPYTGAGTDKIANFNFPDADIVEIAETLGRVTCLNFIFDKDVKGRISIVNNSSITVGDAWKAFLTALDMNGFSIIPSGKFLRIARQRDAKDKQIKTYSGESNPETDLYITRVLPLKFISSEEVARMLRNFMPPNTRIVAYEQTNTLIITDTGANIKKLVEMVSLLDVERYDERVDVVKVRYASATELAKIIDQMISGKPGGGSINPAVSNLAPRISMGVSGVRKTKEGGMISHVIPDERTNSLIVSANDQGLKQVRELVAKLDRKVQSSPGGAKANVLYLEYADAEQIATTLNALSGGISGGAKPTTTGSAGPTTPLFEGSVKVSADKATNSLVIAGSQADFSTVKQVVSKLDISRDQVYVEAVIMETAISRDSELGTSVASPKNGVAFLPNSDFATFLANPLALSGVVLGFQAGKNPQTIPIGNGKSVTVNTIQGLVHALQTNTNGNVLATPQLLTLDNQEAQIEIAEHIPIPTSTAVQGAGVATSITREKIALSLKIKPQINKASEFVKLDIDQKLEDVSNRIPPKGVADLAVATASRSSKTVVVVQDGDTVAMGGLVRDKVQEVTNKVPILGDLPLLGWLFKSKMTSTLKQNLLVFITPRIIKQYQQMRSILDRKIRQRDEFLEQNNGGVDPFLQQKKDMVKDLPAVELLKNSVKIQASRNDADDDDSEPDEPKPIEPAPVAVH